jgi:transposase
MNSYSEDEISGKVIDHLGLISATIEKLGLIKKIDQALRVSLDKGAKVTMGQRVAAMILNGLGFIDDRLYLFPEFLANKPIDRLLGEGLVAEDFNDDVLGRALDKIYDYGTTKLFTEIAFAVGIEHRLLGRSAHFDTSTLWVYGEYVEEESTEAAAMKTKKPIKINHGYSKDHRPDLKQMVINLATTGASGFPIWMETHNGNASDKKILLSGAKRMKAFCNGLKEAPSFLYVGDSALYENCVKDAEGMKWLSRVPEGMGEAKALIRKPDEVFTWSDEGNGYRMAVRESNYGGVKQR